MLCYTDGISEAENSQGSPFGMARLEQFLRQADCNHMEFLERLFRELDDFSGDLAPSDDSTAIVIDFHSNYCRRQEDGTGVGDKSGKG